MFHNPDTYSRTSRVALATVRILLLAGLVALSACGNGDTSDMLPAQPASAKARVKFKGPQRLGNDLVQALSLSRQDVCKELGKYDCLDTHNIVLGGVEPYVLRINEPLPTAPLAAPMAVDRIALSACGERMSRDFAEPDAAALFAEIARAGNSRPADDAMTAVIERLYDRLLARNAEPNEISALIALYDDITTDGAGPSQWAQLSCYAVATTSESLFY